MRSKNYITLFSSSKFYILCVNRVARSRSELDKTFIFFSIVSSTEVTSTATNKQKITTAAKPNTTTRQQLTASKDQKRPGPQQVAPSATKPTQRPGTPSKSIPDAKIILGRKNADRKPVESAKIEKKNVGDAKNTTAVKRNEGLSQAQKPVLQKPVFARGNLAAKVDEKPSLCSDLHKTVVKTGGNGQKVL